MHSILLAGRVACRQCRAGAFCVAADQTPTHITSPGWLVTTTRAIPPMLPLASLPALACWRENVHVGLCSFSPQKTANLELMPSENSTTTPRCLLHKESFISHAFALKRSVKYILHVRSSFASGPGSRSSRWAPLAVLDIWPSARYSGASTIHLLSFNNLQIVHG